MAHTGDVGAESSTVTAGVDGSVDPEEAALDNLRDRRPGVLGDGVPVPSLVDQTARRATPSRPGVSPRAGPSKWRQRFFIFLRRPDEDTAVHKQGAPSRRPFQNIGGAFSTARVRPIGRRELGLPEPSMSEV